MNDDTERDNLPVSMTSSQTVGRKEYAKPFQFQAHRDVIADRYEEGWRLLDGVAEADLARSYPEHPDDAISFYDTRALLARSDERQSPAQVVEAATALIDLLKTRYGLADHRTIDAQADADLEACLRKMGCDDQTEEVRQGIYIALDAVGEKLTRGAWWTSLEVRPLGNVASIGSSCRTVYDSAPMLYTGRWKYRAMGQPTGTDSCAIGGGCPPHFGVERSRKRVDGTLWVS
ncbi:hypothetical protein PG994_004889 [Apiospora phragmitis]|uniref:Uncharacterized protein n=1 Tax=Apiospora phragmitis TaxID=2905665 RepID=A0ABR1VRV4_9PEZI